MSSHDDPIASQLRRDLRQLLEIYEGRLDESKLISAIEATLEERRERLLVDVPASVEVERLNPSRFAVRWSFDHPAVLERELPNILQVQAIYITAEPTPTPMSDVELSILTPSFEPVVLDGRVVHVNGSQVAIQITPPSPAVREALETRPDGLRQLKQKLTKVFPTASPHRTLTQLLSLPEVAGTLYGLNPVEMSEEHLHELASARSEVLSGSYPAVSREPEPEAAAPVPPLPPGLEPPLPARRGALVEEAHDEQAPEPAQQFDRAQATGTYTAIQRAELTQASWVTETPEPPPMSERTPRFGQREGTATRRPLSEVSRERKATPAVRQPSVAPERRHRLRSWHSRDTLFTVLADLAREQSTGALELRTPEDTIHITLQEGAIVGLEHDPPRAEYSLVSLLRSSGRISGAEAAQAAEYAAQHLISQADALLDLHMMEYGDLRVAMKTRLTFILNASWGVSLESAALFAPERQVRRTMAAPVALYKILLKRASQLAQERGPEALEALPKRWRAELLSLIKPLPFDAEKLKLHSKIQRFLSQSLAEPRTLDALLVVSPLNRQDTLVWVDSLHQLGLLHVEAPSAFAQQHTQRLERLEAVMLRLNTQSHFEVLGLHWSAFSEEIEEAARAMLDEFSLEHYQHREHEPETVARVLRIRERTREAYESLNTGKKRAQHRMQLLDDFKMRAAVEMYEKQIEAAKMRQDVEAALDYCRRILELSPQHEEARRDLRMLADHFRRRGPSGTVM